MNRDLAWAQWWAYPWKTAHVDWYTHAGFVDTVTLSRSHHHVFSSLFEIEPALAPQPCPPILQLILTSAQQRDFILLLVNEICNPNHDDRLNEEQHTWCQRLSKALAPDPIPQCFEDPLHCLRAWVCPMTWQRLRLSFPRPRVLELESLPRLNNAPGRLDTLWQAVLWRATSSTANDVPRLTP